MVTKKVLYLCWKIIITMLSSYYEDTTNINKVFGTDFKMFICFVKKYLFTKNGIK